MWTDEMLENAREEYKHIDPDKVKTVDDFRKFSFQLCREAWDRFDKANQAYLNACDDLCRKIGLEPDENHLIKLSRPEQK